jgi:ribonuclease BN (tRNA processing enzyme)
MTFLGAGSAFTPPSQGNFQSNMLMEFDGAAALLVDCGTQVHQSLEAAGKSVRDVGALYVSHPHADHVGGMEEFALKTFNFADPDATERRPLFGNAALLDELWDKTLSGGLGTLQYRVARLDDFFDVRRVPANGGFAWGGVDFRLVRVVHAMNGYEIIPSYGLSFRAGGRRCFLTTDAQFCPEQILDMYRRSDVVFQDCETAPWKSGVHAHYSQLRTLPDDIRAKMWLYHYQPGPLPDAVADGFRGFVARGQQFDFAD